MFIYIIFFNNYLTLYCVFKLYLASKTDMFSIHGLSENQLNRVDKFFKEDVINKIARDTLFVERPPKKITPLNFVIAFLIGCCKKVYTFSEWAVQIGLLSGSETPTRQAMFDRISPKAVEFTKQLLYHTLCDKIERPKDDTLLSPFGKVLVQDSTTFHLSDRLVSEFPGNISNDHEQKGVARIQTIIDIKTMKSIDFSLGSFTDNDQSASRDIVHHAQKGDLVLRDLGYFVLDAFQQLIANEVFILSRLKYGVNVFNPDGTTLNMSALLKGGKLIDMPVLVGAKHKIPFRLIMIPLPAEVAAERIRKARCDKDKRSNHDHQYYERLKYSIFITTVPRSILNPAQAAVIYKMRWQIEIVFKSWKSGLNMKTMLQDVDNASRVKVSIYLMLLFITVFVSNLYARYDADIRKKRGKYISIIKLTKFLYNNILFVFTIDDQHLSLMIETYCTYDTRKDRKNMAQQINLVNTTHI